MFSAADVAVGKAASLGAYSGASGDGDGHGYGYGVLRLAALTRGGFVAVTTDGSVHSGWTDSTLLQASDLDLAPELDDSVNG